MLTTYIIASLVAIAFLYCAARVSGRDQQDAGR